MKNKFHGVMSLILFMAGCLMALCALINYSILIGALYGVVLLVAPSAIIGIYCAKCPCRLVNCGHLLPGKMTKYFPKREQGKYTGFDITIVAISILAMIGIPQYWLWNTPVYFIIFWIFIAIAAVQINRCVCPNCDNHFCVANKNYENG